ncbi:unnamed protein product [Rotaria sordida]|uniref:Potassium channel tetramerisation-type BTB domain-containing protein n=1 Tax=Rotaria sordida TaxID=392033 RepID=A0A814R0B7_9BILA|nr:unnamed protein product [Rotaria sordida]CAF4027859.1 unnamed protein product [Rotaria sordida]
MASLDTSKTNTSPTIITGTLLSTVFSGRWNEKLVKEADGAYFFDYDPVLFKHLINQLRYWSLNPLVTRVFSPPSGNQNEFISFVRCLKFAERFLSDTFSEKENSNVKIVDNQRLCVKIGEDQHCAYVTGTLLYFQGKHFIKLVTALTKEQIGFIGIRPANIPIQVKSTKTYLPISNTFGIDNNCLVVDGHCITIGTSWVTACLSNTFVIELDCDSRTMHIKRDQYYSQIDHGPIYELHLQALLDRLFHLHRLHFISCSHSTWLRPPFQLTHTSVRELGLINIEYSNEQCTVLTRSPLGIQCEVLYIHIRNRTCILDLIQTMANLRFLQVECDENWTNQQSLETTDQLIEWLQSRISSKWMIARQNHRSSPVVLWIR